MGHSHSCWLETTGPHHMGLSVGLLEYPHNMAAGFPRVGAPQERGGSHNVFYDLALEVAHHHVHLALFIKGESVRLAHTQEM